MNCNLFHTLTKLSCCHINQIRSGSMQCCDLYNKVVVITGGAEGIGYEIADKYLERGARITILLDLNEKLGCKAVQTLTEKHGVNRAMFQKCDVTTDLDAICHKLFAYYTVDILVNNAGILDGSQVRRTVDVNLRAVVEWGLKFWKHMSVAKYGKGGTILNLASIYGYRVDPFLPVYQATKFGVIGFTKSLGHPMNYMKSGVRVVALCPGFTVSSMTSDSNRPLWDKSHNVAFTSFLNQQLWQRLDAVGDAAVQLYQWTPSGTAWVIEGAKPMYPV